MIVVSNFDLAKASHAKQAAYNEMAKVQEKMSALSTKISERTAEINERQAEFDAVKKQQEEDWNKYNDGQLALKAEIGNKIVSVKECNTLEENFRFKAESEEDPNKSEIYILGADFFARLASEKMIERDQLISKKRSMMRPDNTRANQLLEHLKTLRSERDELLSDYHALKSELSIKKANFDRQKSKYEAVKNGTTSEVVHDFRPTPLDNKENERLLVEAGIPSEFRESCSIRKRQDGKIDIYYGGSCRVEHGHVVIEDGNVVYSREPKEKTTAI